MADKKINALQNDQAVKSPVTVAEFYTTIDNLYKKVIGDVFARLQTLKTELNNELKYTSAQMNAFFEVTQKDSADIVAKNQVALDNISNELRYGYQQNQMIHEDLVHLVCDDLMAKIAEMGEKITALLQDEKENVAAMKCAVMEEKPAYDFDELVNRVAEKVVESLPFDGKVDYKQIEAIVQGSALDANLLADAVSDKVLEELPPVETEEIDYNRIAKIVADNAPVAEGIDYERLAETVIAKMHQPEAIDYDKLSNMIVEKMPKPVAPKAIEYETIAEMVTAKLLVSEEEKEAVEYDVVLDEEGIDKVAEGVFEKLSADAIVEKIAQKMPTCECKELDYDLLADMVADRLAVKVEILTEPVEEVYEEETVEPAVEEVVAEPVAEETVEVVETVEPVVEETLEEVAEEVVVEPVAEETVEVVETVDPVVEETVEEPVQEEVAATMYESENGDLIDAETGLVLRLKRSFEAKMKQSDESTKVFYDQIKNELVSYNKVKSTVSWHGDRFNLGRATVAKINICGKTLCLYVALDPTDPELKETVYHQKNVGDQKAYQATPFKIKVKSDMGAKKAVRLVGILADKIGATKKEGFVPTDYVEEFAYETTQELLEKGLIKQTQEKKIDFEF